MAPLSSDRARRARHPDLSPCIPGLLVCQLFDKPCWESSGGASGSAPQDTAATTATSKPTIAAAITEADVSIDPLSALSVMPDDPLAQAVPDAVARMGSGFLDTWKSTQEGARDQAALAGGAARNSRVIGDVQVLYSRVAGAKQEQMAEASKPKPTAASRFQSLFMTRGTANPVAVGKRAPDDVAGQMGPAKHLIRHQVTLPFPEGGYKTDPASLLPLEGPIWMTIGMPTFPRAGNPDYLQRSVLSFLSGLPLDTTDLFYGKIQLVIMNNKPGDHKTFYAVREQMRQLASPDKERAAAHIVFVENPGTIIDPEPNLEEPNDKNNPEALPGSHVRNQTAQVLELTKLLKDKSKLFMFVEDDFIFCTNWLEATQMALKKASVLNPAWGALRISFGMSGLILRNGDLPHFMHWAWRNITKLPIDVIWVEYLRLYLLPAGRDLFVYHKVLLEHIGTVSSFAAREKRSKWPGCFEPMDRVWSLTKWERFDRISCLGSDVSPCHAKSGRGPASPLPEWMSTNIDWHP
eukprot:jgi/Mesvir1/4045/Mv26552-RA.1